MAFSAIWSKCPVEDFFNTIGTCRKSCPTYLKAAYGSIADPGEPSTGVFMSSRPRSNVGLLRDRLRARGLFAAMAEERAEAAVALAGKTANGRARPLSPTYMLRPGIFRWRYSLGAARSLRRNGQGLLLVT
jgi:hypothetical protein